MDNSLSTQSHSVISPSASAVVAVLILMGTLLYTGYSRYFSDNLDSTINSTATIGTSTPTRPDVVIPSTISIGEALASSYQDLKVSGDFSTSSINAVTTRIASQIPSTVVYNRVTVFDIKTTNDTSVGRVREYREDIRKALRPLLDNKTSEIELYGMYTQTQNDTYLTLLEQSAVQYERAASNTLSVVAPTNARALQTDTINALREFSAAIHALRSSNADPITAAAALKAFSQSHSDILSSFGALTSYFSQQSL